MFKIKSCRDSFANGALKKCVLLMPLAETIKELVSYILKGVDLVDHTSYSLFLAHQLLCNSYIVYSIIIFLTGTSSEFFLPVYPQH